MTWRLQIPFSGGRARALSRSELRGAVAPRMRAASSAPTGLVVSSLNSAPASAGAFSNSPIGAHRPALSPPGRDALETPSAQGSAPIKACAPFLMGEVETHLAAARKAMEALR